MQSLEDDLGGMESVEEDLGGTEGDAGCCGGNGIATALYAATCALALALP